MSEIRNTTVGSSGLFPRADDDRRYLANASRSFAETPKSIRLACASVILMTFVLSVGADVSFETEVLPIFQKSCSACHFPPVEPLKGKLDLSTLAGVTKGGADGVVIVAGKADESRLVQMIEGKLEPMMPPPGKADPVSAEHIALIKQWVNEGAKGLDAGAPAPAPVPAAAEAEPAKPKPVRPAGISSMAYAPDGPELLLARGSLHTVELLVVDVQSGAMTTKATLEGHAEMVRALAFSPDGTILAAGGGKPGRGGEVKLWNVADGSLARTMEGHKDNVLGLAFSPDGKRLVTAGYDKTLIIWDVETGAAAQTLSNHVDAVYCVAWSPDGSRIASGAGDRTVKVWDAAGGTLLQTISDALDVVLAVAFSPSGTELAGAGADKIIRVWDAGSSEAPFQQSGSTAGTLKGSTFAHEGAVLHLLYSPDGSTLYSTGEDRRIKAWDSASLQEKLAFEEQPDWVTALALSPDGKLLAAGRYDASSAIYATDTGAGLAASATDEQELLAVASEQPQGPKKVSSLSVEAVIIRATVPPSVQSIAPDRWHRGAEIELAVSGRNLDRAEPIVTNPKIAVEILENEALPEPELKLGEGPRGTGADIFDNARPHRLKLKLTTAEDAPLGRYELMFRTPIGMSNSAVFNIIPSPDTPEAEPNDSLDQAQPVQWPVVVVGQTNAAGDLDRFRVSLKAGEEISCAITDSAMNTILRVLDGAGGLLADSGDFNDPKNSRLGFKAESDGDYIIEVGDWDLRAGLGYRLHVGRFPLVESVWPLGVPAGAPQRVEVAGFNLGATSLEVDPPDEAGENSTVRLPLHAVEGSPIAIPSIAVGRYPEGFESEPNNAVEQANAIGFPSITNARIQAETESEPDVDLYRFSATKDRPIIIETRAARYGSPLDSKIEVLDLEGNLLQRAVVRCVAQTAITLSGRDSRQQGLRLESWRDLKVNDYVMVGGEIIQVSQVPDYGDEDVIFKGYANGQRMGLFGTTPEHHAVFDSVFKVTVHSVGTEFAPNGMPVFPVYWRNDDGFTANGESNGDSYLEFVAPENGDYLVRVADVRGQGGPLYSYRLSLRPPAPDFDVSAGPYHLSIAPGNRVPIDVRVAKHDGFDGEVKVQLHDLPQGFNAEPDVILPGEDLVRLALVAGPGAKSTPMDSRFRITAESTINGVPVVKETAIGTITVGEVEPDLAVQNGVERIAIEPGKSGQMSVKLARANGFDSRVPINVLNLPFGVTVMYTGLNGILVREGETDRSMELYVEPWVRPMQRKIYIQAQIETQTPQKPVFLGEPILLDIGGAQVVAKK